MIGYIQTMLLVIYGATLSYVVGITSPMFWILLVIFFSILLTIDIIVNQEDQDEEKDCNENKKDGE